MSVIARFLLPGSRPRANKWIYTVGITLMIVAMESELRAQSGRRASAIPTPNSASTPEPNAPTPTQPTPPVVIGASEKVRLLFARQPTSKRFANEDVIAASFFKRLTDFLNVDCTSIGDLKQAQARARAKSESDAFVVLLKFDINTYQSGTIILNSPDLAIEYFAFAPRTGKKHVNGKVYFQTIGGGRMQKSGWPNGTPIRITPEAAGIEAAETLHHLLLVKNIVKPQP